MIDPVALLKAKIGPDKRSLRQLAREIPCSAPYLHDVLHGNRAPGPRILEYLRLERRNGESVSYHRRRRK